MEQTTTTSTSASPSPIPTVPLGILGVINGMDVETIFTELHDAQATSFSFDPNGAKATPHTPFESTNTLPASSVVSTFTPTPTLQVNQNHYRAPPWQDTAWMGIATWLLAIYSLVSFVVMAMLWATGKIDWRLNILLNRRPDRRRFWTQQYWPMSEPNEAVRMRSLSIDRRGRAIRYRNSVETELGDPADDREGAIEEIRRQWAERGMLFTPEQLRAQQQAYEDTVARAAARARRDAIVVANLRAHGLLI